MTAIIGKTAPQPAIECWVQGYEPPLSELLGQVVLIEVIQVNCPGCFIHALPEAVRLHQQYASQGLKIFVIATAFEHFDNNTLNNLERLLHQGELQGDPLQQLGSAGFLQDGKLPYQIPFSVAMDKLVRHEAAVSAEDVDRFILSQIPDFYQGAYSDEKQQAIVQQAKNYLDNKTCRALTFEMYNLQGTPSSILIDKKGILRDVSFGALNVLEGRIRELLAKPA